MELCQAKSLGVFDNNNGRVRRINANFYDSRCHQNVYVSGFKTISHTVFFLGLHPAVNQTYAATEMGG